LDEFLSRPEEMRTEAVAIRAAAAAGLLDSLAPLAEGEQADDEGRVLERLHRTRERSRGLREKKIREALTRGQRLSCEACGFDYVQVYGERGAGYIECHHTMPLHVVGEGRTRLRDLALICANCHRVIHKGASWLTMDELRGLIATHRDGVTEGASVQVHHSAKA
jgi:5-methylcytosine-specific restriction protein A